MQATGSSSSGSRRALTRLWELAPVLVPIFYVALWCLFFGLRVALTKTLIAQDYQWNVTRNTTCSSDAIMAQFPEVCQSVRKAVQRGLWATAFWDAWDNSTPCGGKPCMEVFFGEWSLVGLFSKAVAIAGLSYLGWSFVHVVNLGVHSYSHVVRAQKQDKFKRRLQPQAS